MVPFDINFSSDEEKWSALLRHEKLGDILLKQGLITLHQLEQLTQAASEKSLGEALLESGLVSKEHILEALKLQEQSEKVAQDSVNELKEKHK